MTHNPDWRMHAIHQLRTEARYSRAGAMLGIAGLVFASAVTINHHHLSPQRSASRRASSRCWSSADRLSRSSMDLLACMIWFIIGVALGFALGVGSRCDL